MTHLAAAYLVHRCWQLQQLLQQLQEIVLQQPQMMRVTEASKQQV
jgi:hypothetical protein